MEAGREIQPDQNFTDLTVIRTANKCLEEAKHQPALKQLFGTLWQSGELTFLAGDTGKGKTILGVSIADIVSKGGNLLLNQPVQCKGKVLYYDFELNDRQFHQRYKDYQFSDNFYRIVINPWYLGIDSFSIDTIKSDVERTGAEVIIIDNITALSLRSTQNQDEALILMRGLKALTLSGLSILVLAHTPKVAEGKRLNVNHLAGSKHLANFADSVFFIAQSNENPDYRYLKQVKSRNAGQLFEVIVCEITNTDNYLGFEFVRFDKEDSHVAVTVISEPTEITEEMQKAFELHKTGKSYRYIASELGVGKSTVDRWIKTCNKMELSGKYNPHDSIEEGQNKPDGTTGQDNIKVELKEFPDKNDPEKNDSIEYGTNGTVRQDAGMGQACNQQGASELYGVDALNDYAIRTTNTLLKKWVADVLHYSSLPFININDLKRILEESSDFQTRMAYNLLPSKYPFRDFLDTLLSSIKSAVKYAEENGLNKFSAELEEERKKELQDVLDHLNVVGM